MYPGVRQLSPPLVESKEHRFVKFVPGADEMRVACARCRRLLTLDETVEPCAPEAST